MNENLNRYFPPEQSIAARCGRDVSLVLKTIASKYIGENPPYPFSFRAYSREGFLCLPDGRFDINLAEKFPEAAMGQISCVKTGFYKNEAGHQLLNVSCYGPVCIKINGSTAYRSEVKEEVNVRVVRQVDITYKAGQNELLILCRKTASGFGCILGVEEPRWNWISFVCSQHGWEDRLGFNYTRPYEQGNAHDDEEAGMEWLPNRRWGIDAGISPWERLFGGEKRKGRGRIAYGWSSMRTGKCRIRVTCRFKGGKGTVFLDGKQIHFAPGNCENVLEVGQGLHQVVMRSVCPEEGMWEAEVCFTDEKGAIIPFEMPVLIHGTDEKWLYMGLLKEQNRHIEAFPSLYDSFSDTEGTYWRIDEPETVVRPVLENALYGRWNYPLGVTLYGLIETGRMLKDESIISYVSGHINECTSLYEYSLWDAKEYGYPEINNQLVGMTMLDDCGSFGSAMLELTEGKDRISRLIADRIALHMREGQERREDGAFYRALPGHFMEDTLWVDDLYMSVPFLCRYYKLTGDTTCLEDAAKQFELFKKYLQIPGETVMSHVYDFKYETPTLMPWGRGNGWCFFSLAELLTVLPEVHEKRGWLTAFYREFAAAIRRLQGSSGMWHQLLTHSDSYEETSCTAMFVYGLCKGIRNGWFDDDEAEKSLNSARRGWEALTRRAVDSMGNVHGICKGSAYSFTPDYYKERLLWGMNDPHGIGIVLLAGLEWEKTK